MRGTARTPPEWGEDAVECQASNFADAPYTPRMIPTKSDLDAYAATMRRNPTPSERLLVKRLRAAGLSVATQVQMGFWILDIVIGERGIVIEVDGKHHQFDRRQARNDRQRDGLLRRAGIVVVRLLNQEAATYPVHELLSVPPFPASRWTDLCTSLAQRRDGWTARKERACRGEGLRTPRQNRVGTRRWPKRPFASRNVTRH